MCTVYANNAPAGVFGPGSVHLWIEQPLVVRPDSLLPAGLDKIQWQTPGYVYLIEMTEPTLRNLFVCIDRILAWGYRYHLLVGVTRQGTHMLLDDPEEPLPVAAMISIRNSRHVRKWWPMNSLIEPLDKLRCGHCTHGADGTSPPDAVNFGPGDNRRQSGNPSIHSDELDSDSHQGESSTVAAKRITRLSTKKPGSSMPALDSGFTYSPSKQLSAPPTDLGICAWRAGRQIGRETNLKKVFRLSTRRAVHSSGKCGLAAMAEADELNCPADTAQPPRMVARSVPIIESSIEGEPDRLYGEVNRSRQPTATPSTPNSPPPFSSSLSHDLASAASEQFQLRTAAEDLLMLASSARQPADTSPIQVGRPSRSHSPSNLWADDARVDMAAPDAGRKFGLATSSRATSSQYFTPGKLRLQLLALSSAMLAAGPTALSAETDLRSPLRLVSAD